MALFGLFSKKQADNSTAEKSAQNTQASTPREKINIISGLTLEERYGKASFEAFSSNDWDKAEKEFQSLETEGCSEASVALGQLYTQNDRIKAIEHFRNAADKGDAEAAWGTAALIGHQYNPDTGGADKEWFMYCVIAAKGGCADAMNELGNIYKRKSKAIASFYWYLKAAYYEHPDGWFSVQNTIQNVKADASLEEKEDIPGISKEESDNARKIFNVFSGRVRLTQEVMNGFMSDAMGDTEIMGMFIGNFFEQQQMDGNAKMGYQLAAHSNSVIGMKCLADMQAAGRGCERDMSKAMGWYMGAAEAGNAQAAFVVAQMYKSKPYLAAYWYSYSYRRGYQPALQALLSLQIQ